MKFKELCSYLQHNYPKYPYIIIPGGGIFADSVRKIDKKYKLEDKHSHFMAILSENLVGYLIHALIANSKLISNINKLNHDWIENNANKIPILLPFKHLISKDPLPHSWEITSDSIAYYFSHVLGIEKTILVKDVDGLFDRDPKKFSNTKIIKKITAIELKNIKNKTVVDTYLSKLIIKYKNPCFIVNGYFPERISDILKNKLKIGTIITNK